MWRFCEVAGMLLPPSFCFLQTENKFSPTKEFKFSPTKELRISPTQENKSVVK
jgi:hypothetical protein